MATEVILPRVDMDMAEGKIAYWHVQDGQAVDKGQVLFDIETDKATMEVDAPASGVLDIVRAELGVAIPVGEVVAWIRAADEARTRTAVPAAASSDAGAPATAATAPSAPASPDASAPAAEPGVLRATPLARSQARAQGLDLAGIAGSGPRGRIVAADLPPPVAPVVHGAHAAGGGPVHLQTLRPADTAPLLLIHGFGSDQASWRPLVQALGTHLPASVAVLGVDLPGHGKSAPLPGARLQELAQAVLDAVAAQGWARFHVVGHSLGGGVALALARLQPQRVRSLTLLAPAGLGPEVDADFLAGLSTADSPQTLRPVLARLFHDEALLTESFVATAWQQLSKPGRAESLAALAATLMPAGRQAEDLRAVLAASPVPVKLIWGREDRVMPVRHADGLPGHVAVHRLPGVGHVPQIEAVELVARLVAEQLRAAG
ncbi:MAG: Dihydrolipoyllysine-residue acetyltransferase component of acetoin cleaving system [Paracidovorax wautersii]|uniref:Dihydrolipoyllysine-residue acetyltransferase component of acetoin cleaving system n=1 Tax=Paracidovorax wautersii TaxID=1177982 RepID=A0A7V8JRL0_9BURK|nr:MAG: Dihydrolipoyllysine-residue acetyltransferase component of acetoin cleaving system [Paracidovorax wautersii]